MLQTQISQLAQKLLFLSLFILLIPNVFLAEKLEAQDSEGGTFDSGGEIVWAWPCVFPWGFWTVTLTKNGNGEEEEKDIIYPWFPYLITRGHFLPTGYGTIAISRNYEEGECEYYCGVTLCTYDAPISILHGNASQQ